MLWFHFTTVRIWLTRVQVAWCGWVWDAFDFFTVSLTVTQLAQDFQKSNTQITWGITLVLMFRSVGSFTFGLWSDRSGRKWPFIWNHVLFIVLELATGFCKTYNQFLACRALFGIAMGGLYGNAAATALEDSPAKARGVLSGCFQAGYPAGYLLATAFFRALVDTTPHGWRPLYWFGACPPILIIIFRMMLPENRSWREREVATPTRSSASRFFSEAKSAIMKNWLTVFYMVALMAGFNFMVSPVASIASLSAYTKLRRMAPRISTRRCSSINTSSRRINSLLSRSLPI
jgi:SHS family lactate transporter-like MFS transporter